MKSVLYINKKDQEKLFAVRACCAMNKIHIAELPEEDGLPEDAELMKLCGFDNKAVNDFLASLRSMGIRVDLKCVETEKNREWPLIKLYKELKEEHEFMHNKGNS